MATVLGYLTVDEKGRTTIPREMRLALGLEAGTQLRVDRLDDGAFELIPAEVIPRDQLWFHTPEVQARVAKAEADFREGRSSRTEGPEDTQRFLDSLKLKASGDTNCKD